METSTQRKRVLDFLLKWYFPLMIVVVCGGLTVVGWLGTNAQARTPFQIGATARTTVELHLLTAYRYSINPANIPVIEQLANGCDLPKASVLSIKRWIGQDSALVEVEAYGQKESENSSSLCKDRDIVTVPRAPLEHKYPQG